MVCPEWTVVRVEDWKQRLASEPLGSKEKFWVRDPENQSWLFKYARVIDGTVRGEDWAEWLVTRLAGVIGVPTVTVRPAEYAGRRGVLSGSVVPAGCRLTHGNELLGQSDHSYDGAMNRENPGYTPLAVRHCLAAALPPSGWPDLSGFTAFDVWAGYLMLDAWVAGRDRHHENWAVVPEGDGWRLYPSFDHGNALGFQENDTRRRALADDEAGLSRWVRKGKSHHFAGRPTLVRVARQALDLAAAEAREYWLGRLAEVDPVAIEELVSAVPARILSDPARRFCIRLLDLNRRRVLDGD